jgi:hypothetical protein
MQNQQGQIVWAITNPFGYYRFTNVEVGQTYIFSVDHKRYTFEPRTISLSDDLTDLDFTPQSLPRSTSGKPLPAGDRSP